MKKLVFPAILMGCCSYTYAVNFELVSSGAIGNNKIELYRALDKGYQRKNPDGSVFYKTTYKVSLKGADGNKEKILESDLYTAEDLNFNGMWPSLLIDPTAKVITIFANGKGDNNGDYSMVGYAYRLDGNKQWNREVVFSSGNYGWFSYFGGSSSGNPELWHFSFAGYKLLKSIRDSSGEWKTFNTGGVRPEQAAADQRSKSKIIISSSFGTQQPNVQTSNSSNDAAVAGALIGTAIAGAAIVGAIKWLFTPSSSGSYEHSSSDTKYSPSLYDYSCVVYCLDPSGTTKVVVKAEDRSDAANKASDQSRQICQNAGYGREHQSNMSSGQCQLK